MALPTAKELKKIADACRKAGIAYFKCADFEFTLSPQAQAVAAPKKSRKATVDNTPMRSNPDELSDEELLFWSAPASPDESAEA